MKDVAEVVAFVVAMMHVAEMFLLRPVLSVEVIRDCVDAVDYAVAVGFWFHLCLISAHQKAPWPTAAILVD